MAGLAHGVVAGELTARAIEVVRVPGVPTPLTVKVALPSVAVLDAASVSTLLLPLVGSALKVAVTPVGKPATPKSTEPVKPPERVIAIVLVALAPRFTVTLPGLADNAKFGVATSFTVSAMVVERVPGAPTPLTVTVALPSVAALEAASVSTLLVPVVGSALNVAVTPAGNPLALRSTEPVKPFTRVMVIVLVPLAPRVMASEVGAAESEKSGVVVVAGWPYTIPRPLVERYTRPKTRGSPVIAPPVKPY